MSISVLQSSCKELVKKYLSDLFEVGVVHQFKTPWLDVDNLKFKLPFGRGGGGRGHVGGGGSGGSSYFIIEIKTNKIIILNNQNLDTTEALGQTLNFERVQR